LLGAGGCFCISELLLVLLLLVLLLVLLPGLLVMGASCCCRPPACCWGYTVWQCLRQPQGSLQLEQCAHECLVVCQDTRQLLLHALNLQPQHDMGHDGSVSNSQQQARDRAMH
jgi:hypothetical protein